jgi:hypothetical protein
MLAKKVAELTTASTSLAGRTEQIDALETSLVERASLFDTGRRRPPHW